MSESLQLSEISPAAVVFWLHYPHDNKAKSFPIMFRLLFRHELSRCYKLTGFQLGLVSVAGVSKDTTGAYVYFVSGQIPYDDSRNAGQAKIFSAIYS